MVSVDAVSVNGLQAVYLEHRDALLRFLRARGAGARADDLVQEVWLRLTIAPIGPVANPRAYLYQVANNLMINAHRDERRAAARDLRWGEAHAGDVEPPAEERLVARQEVAQVRARLARAGTRVLDSYVMFRAEGLTQRDIAVRLGVSVSTVEKDIQRAYRVLAASKDEFDD